ncbi:hypothetical protein [Gordonia soli]|uniref:Uncharacterized protein n=1 Tax=Gordonia soli NBRC 108243 TaxID=1223545 RepID=M0QI60_9ACTN|nr:hypothetical protein [Gordonia soli]GAC68233.1 hypothetical protein GS4_14_00640 [Gordonia soli NBRC 108243]
MSDKTTEPDSSGDESAPETHLAVGTTVVVDMTEGPSVRGVIVDDYGDLAGAQATIDGRDVRSRRWAITLDDGRITFRDSDELAPSPASE